MRKSTTSILMLLGALSLLTMTCSGPNLSFGLFVTPTPTPNPTQTITPTPTPEPVQLVGEYVARVGGFSFRPPVRYLVDENERMVVLSNPGRTILFSFTRFPTAAGTDPAALLDDVMSGAGQGVSNFEVTDPAAITIGGAAGIQADFSGLADGDEMVGRVAVVSTGEDEVFITALAAYSPGRWETEGAAVFEAVMETMVFVEPQATPCAVSADPTYGFTQENPIRVGGGEDDGPRRGRTYFSALAGLHDEPIYFDWEQSIPTGDTFLSAYRVEYSRVSVVLYVDEDSYRTPLAPAGFSCAGPFLFLEP